MSQAAMQSGERWSASEASQSAAGPGVWRPMWAMWHREVVRFVRQRNRVVGALATPIVFWLLLGFGLNSSFHVAAGGAMAGAAAPFGSAASGGGGMGYLAYFFPGTVILILLFTAIFSTISVIEDRREGFLQGVMVCPAPRVALVLGKIMGGASIAVAQGLLFLLVWPLVGGVASWVHVLSAIGIMIVLAIGLTGLGMCIAWPMDSTAGFHAIMNLLLMPMWFLCGAVFPVSGAPLWMKVVMYANPLTYGQSAFSWAIHDMSTTALAPWVAAGASVVFAAAMVLAATRIAGRG